MTESNDQLKCDSCNGTGYLYVQLSLGLKPGDVYNEPHIERCDTCMRFQTDQEALSYRCQQAVAENER